MRLQQILFSQGFGTRRECSALIAAGRVHIGGGVCTDETAEFETQGLSFEVEGQRWPFHARALVLLNKPAGTECSQRPSAWPSVMSLLPLPLRRRGVQAVGRLDQDSTGALLLTDDGVLLHRLTSPKWHVPKTYQVRTARAVDATQIASLLAGVVLRDEPQAVRAAAARQTGPSSLELVLTEGKYHQVKRMLAAVGNHVEALHRSAIGALSLPPGLAPGAWCWVDEAELKDT
jgi:16S rRNA pseudouridine516 synthase